MRIITVFLGAMPFLIASTAFTGTVTLATHDLFPYGYYNATSEFTGCAIDRVRYAVAQCGFELNIRVVPWARAQSWAKDDTVDGFFAASMNDERRASFVASDILAPQDWTWYVLQDYALHPDSSEFKRSANVGCFIGANMLTYLKENGYNVFGTPKDTEGLFEMLLLRRLDAILANSLVAEGLIDRLGLEGKVHAYTFIEKPLYALFTKRFIANNPQFLQCFNAALAGYNARHGSGCVFPKN